MGLNRRVHMAPADPHFSYLPTLLACVTRSFFSFLDRIPYLILRTMGSQTSKPAVAPRAIKAAPVQTLSEKPLIEAPPVDPPEDEDPNETYASVTTSSLNRWHSSLEAVGPPGPPVRDI